MFSSKKLIYILREIVRAAPQEFRHLRGALSLFFWQMICPVSCVVFGLWLCYMLEKKIYRMIFPLTAKEMHEEAVSILKKNPDFPARNEQQPIQYYSHQHNYHEYNLIISATSTRSSVIDKNNDRNRALLLLQQCINKYPTFLESYVTLASEYLYGNTTTTSGSTSSRNNNIGSSSSSEQENIEKSLEVIQKGLRYNPKHEELLKLEIEAKAMKKAYGHDGSVRHMMCVGLDLR